MTIYRLKMFIGAIFVCVVPAHTINARSLTSLVTGAWNTVCEYVSSKARPLYPVVPALPNDKKNDWALPSDNATDSVSSITAAPVVSNTSSGSEIFSTRNILTGVVVVGTIVGGYCLWKWYTAYKKRKEEARKAADRARKEKEVRKAVDRAIETFTKEDVCTKKLNESTSSELMILNNAFDRLSAQEMEDRQNALQDEACYRKKYEQILINRSQEAKAKERAADAEVQREIEKERALLDEYQTQADYQLFHTETNKANEQLFLEKARKDSQFKELLRRYEQTVPGQKERASTVRDVKSILKRGPRYMLERLNHWLAVPATDIVRERLLQLKKDLLRDFPELLRAS